MKKLGFGIVALVVVYLAVSYFMPNVAGLLIPDVSGMLSGALDYITDLIANK